MPKYQFTVVTVVEVDAENVMEAVRHVRKVKVIGSRCGQTRKKNDRDPVRFEVRLARHGIHGPQHMRRRLRQHKRRHAL